MDKLLPCPFCGGKAELINDDTTTYGFPTPNWAVRCVMENCIGHDIEPRYSQMESAIEDWNTRPEPENKPLTWEEICDMGKCPVWLGRAKKYGLISALINEPYKQIYYATHEGFTYTVLFHVEEFYRHKPKDEL